MIPEIEFRFSRIYDELFRSDKETIKYFEDKKMKYPSKEDIIKFIKTIEKEFNKNKLKILNEISKISGLKWKEQKIIIYVVGSCVPFSDPLTIPYGYDTEKTIKLIIHELIHQIQIQGADNWDKWWNYLEKNYPKETITTKSHIFLNAVDFVVLSEALGEKEANLEIKHYDKLPDYKRAWEIVMKETPKKIIMEFNHITNPRIKKK